MNTISDSIHLSLVTIWTYLRNVGYLFIIFILGWILFNSLDQSRDFVLAFIEGPELGYYISVAILLFFWSYMTWYSSCIILEISPENNHFIDEKLASHFCRSMGFVPALILAITFFKEGAVLIGAGCLVLGLLFVMFFKWRDKLNRVPGKWPTSYDVMDHNTDSNGEEITPTIKQEIQFIRRFPNVWYYFKNFGIVFIIILLLLSFPSILIWCSRSLRPAAVVILALSFFTYTFTVAFYFHDIKARPFVVLIFIWMIGISSFNDNTRIPIIKTFSAQKDFRLTPKEAFEKWFDQKQKAWYMVHPDTTQEMPVIFIATQGGGIRGEIWTSEALNLLKDSLKGFKGFYDQVFCIGGASGGTVGAVYYNAYVYDSLKNYGKNAAMKFENFQGFTCADCLSPVTASFAFTENLQHFIPFKMEWVERSKITMQAFSSSYKDHMNSTLTDSSMLSMYYQNDDPATFNCNLPSLFINGTLAETGQRVITSNLKIKGLNNFSNDIDFFDKAKGHISIATASLSCMRFPLLLSGGLFYDVKGDDEHSVGHIVDGGYLENTGLQAMYSLMSELKDNFKGRKIKPILIYLRNGGAEFTSPVADKNNAFKMLHDIQTPAKTLLNVNGTSVPSSGIMKMVEQQEGNYNPLNMYYNQLWLKDLGYEATADSNGTFPLGLYISDSACNRLRTRAQEIPVINRDLMDTLGRYFQKPR